MAVYETFVTRLLRKYHGGKPVTAEDYSPLTPQQIDYFCDVGLGPIAFDLYGEMLQATEPEGFSTLQSADLTTRVIYSQLEDATVELLGSLQDAGIAPILLKGISTAFEFYSPPHFRLMGDVDLLVKKSEVDATITTVADLGYLTADKDWQEYYETGHHHLPAAYHPKSNVCLEVHTELFEPDTPFANEPIFQPNEARAQTLDFDYRGISATRFTPEFQLIYTISHWGVDGGWSMNLTSINDTLHILRTHESELNWSTIADWLAANPWLYSNLAALMIYLDKADIFTASPSMWQLLENSGGELQPATRKILLWLLNYYPFNSREKPCSADSIWRGRMLWQDLTRPGYRDVSLPYSILRTLLRTVHRGKTNPVEWFSHLLKHVASRFRRHR